MNNITPMSSAKKFLWAAAAAAAIAVAIFAWRSDPPLEPESPAQATLATSDVIVLTPEARRSARLLVVPVSQRPVETTLRATGRVAANQNRTAHIYPLTRGIVEQVVVQLGDWVEAGAPLLYLDSIELSELLQRWRSTGAELARVEAQVRVAGSSLERAEALFAAEAISRREYERRQAEHQQALSDLRSAEAELAQVETNILRHGFSRQQLEELRSAGFERPVPAGRSVLKAPFAGLIIHWNATRGEILDTNHEVAIVADTSVVWVLADIYEKDLGQLRQGQPCQVRVPAYAEEVFTGRVTYLSSLLDPHSRTSKLRCEVPNPDRRLKLEMFATVEIPAGDRRMATAIPQSAVQRLGSQTVVFVAEDGARFRKQQVELGTQFGEWWEVRGGLETGDQVASEGSFYLKSALLSEQISGGE